MPYCGYDEVIEVIGLPEFATHDPEEKTFSIQAKSQDDIGIYKVAVIATIPGTQFQQSDEFTIIVNPC